MSRRLFSRLVKTAGILGVGAGGVIGYKAYRKSVKHLPDHKYLTDTQDRLDKSTIQYPLKSRADHLKEASQTDYDILVIGGGCNGAGVVLEAASRGLKALLVEEYDFAAGTSSKSTKLIHGGVRYLEEVFALGGTHRQEKLELVVEALQERSYMLQNAQYMNKPLPTVIPTFSLFKTIYYYAGSLMYHFIYYIFDDERNITMMPLPYILGRQEVMSIFPKLDQKVKYGVVYFDGQNNDSRMNMDILLTSTLDNYIADKPYTPSNILNYTKFSDFVKDEQGNITGGVLQDKISGKTFNVKAKSVVNCTGAFADTIRQLDNPKTPSRIIPCEGSHLIMDMGVAHRKYGLLVPRTTDGRVLFVLPWLNSALVGTTDQRIDKAEMDPTVPQNDVQFIIGELAKLYPEIPTIELRNRVLAKWSGIRPLVKELPQDVDNVGKEDRDKPVETKSISRKHVIEKSKSGLISLMGGKWTTYRRMGEETVDEVVNLLKSRGHSLEGVRTKSITKELRLLGQFRKNGELMDRFERKETLRQASKAIVDRYNIEQDIAKHLVKQYGERAFDVAKFFAKNSANKQRVHEKHPFTIGEIRYHLKYELGVTPIDVLFRRTRLGFLDIEAVYQVYPKILDIFAEEFNWSEEKKVKEAKEHFEKIRKMNF